jgi:hypothetical protein
LRSGMVIPPAVLLLLRVVFTILGILSLSRWIWEFLFSYLWRIVLWFWWGFHWIYRLPLIGWPFLQINSANQLSWEISPFSEIFDFFLEKLEIIVIQIFQMLGKISTPRYFILFVTILKGFLSLISFSACL